jgi:hypothetical protein
MESFKVNIPKGFVVDKDKSTDSELVFKEVVKKLPMSWEEPDEIKGSYIIDGCVFGASPENRDVFPTKEADYAAGIVLPQLLQLRDVYRDGWKPVKGEYVYPIYFIRNVLRTDSGSSIVNEMFSFKTEETRDLFYNTFKEQLNELLPLYT